jgi:hypothetical protein
MTVEVEVDCVNEKPRGKNKTGRIPYNGGPLRITVLLSGVVLRGFSQSKREESPRNCKRGVLS